MDVDDDYLLQLHQIRSQPPKQVSPRRQQQIPSNPRTVVWQDLQGQKLQQSARTQPSQPDQAKIAHPMPMFKPPAVPTTSQYNQKTLLSKPLQPKAPAQPDAALTNPKVNERQTSQQVQSAPAKPQLKPVSNPQQKPVQQPTPALQRAQIIIQQPLQLVQPQKNQIQSIPNPTVQLSLQTAQPPKLPQETQPKKRTATTAQPPAREELLKILRFRLPSETVWKQLKLEAESTVFDCGFRASQLEAIQQLIEEARGKYVEQRLKIKTQLLTTTDQKTKQLKIKQMYYLAIKQNWKTHQFAKRLITVVSDGRNFVYQQLALGLMRRHSQMERMLIKYKIIMKRNIFQQIMAAYHMKSADQQVADQIAQRGLRRGLLYFMQLHSVQAQIDDISQQIYETKIIKSSLDTLKLQIKRRVLQRQHIFGHNSDDDVNQQSSLLEQLYDELERLNASKTVMTRQLRSIFIRNHLPKLNLIVPGSALLKTRQLELSTFSGVAMTRSAAHLKQFSVQMTKVVNRQPTTAVSRINFFKSKRNIVMGRLYKSNQFNLEQLPFKLRQFLQKQSTEAAVDVLSNLFLMKKALSCLNFAQKREAFYKQCALRGQFSRLKFELQRLRQRINCQKEDDERQIEEFRNEQLKQIAFYSIYRLSQQELTEVQQQKAVRCFKIIIVRRQIIAWKTLVQQLKYKYQNMQILIKTLKIVTLTKPAFGSWLSLTRYVKETRQKKQILLQATTQRQTKANFETWRKKTKLRLVLRKVLMECQQRYVLQSQWSKTLFLQCYQLLKSAPHQRLSLRNVTMYAQQKLILQALKSWQNAAKMQQTADQFHSEAAAGRAMRFFALWNDSLMRLYTIGSGLKRKADKFSAKQCLLYGLFRMHLSKLAALAAAKSTFASWRAHCQSVFRADSWHQQSVRGAALKYLQRYQQEQNKIRFVARRVGRCACRQAFGSLVEEFVKRLQVINLVENQLNEAANILYLTKLERWAAGKPLMSAQRMLSQHFAAEFEGENGVAAQKYQMLYDLTLEQQALQAWRARVRPRVWTE